MKKTLKLVGIFIAILTIGITGALSVYFIMQKNKTYHIYDLRIVEPVEGANTYIYKNTERVDEYKTFKNKKVYMTAGEDNMFEIAIYADATNGASNLKIVSSDPSVADIEFKENRCFVKYKKAGETTITAKIEMVTDSFDLYVYNQVAEGFIVYDRTYYGIYAEMFSNKIVSYADDKSYTYDFLTNSSFATEDDNGVNGDLLVVDPESVNNDVFENVSIDASSRKLIVQCKSSLSASLIAEGKPYVDESIVIQSYYYSAEGEAKPSKSYVVDVHVIADAPEFLQIVVSATPDFEDSFVFMDSLTKDFSRATEDEIVADIENFLLYQKAEQYLAENGEKSTYKAFFTNKVSEIYLKFRKVYTNGDIVYLNPLTANDPKDPHTYEVVNMAQLEEFLILSQNKEYFTLRLDKIDFDASLKLSINLKLLDFERINKEFVFEFKDFTAENVEDFYDYYSQTNSFVYKYWDQRTAYNSEVCDASGRVINFGGIVVDFETLTPVDDVEDSEDSEEGSGDGEEGEEGTE